MDDSASTSLVSTPTHTCPLCGKPGPVIPGHPKSVCGPCILKATDADSTPVSIKVGSGSSYVKDGAPYTYGICWIDKTLCEIKRPDYGMVVSKVDEDKITERIEMERRRIQENCSHETSCYSALCKLL